MKFLLTIVYSVLPSLLNKLTANPHAWDAAIQLIKSGMAKVTSKELTYEQLPEFFAGGIADELEHTAHPTRYTHFLREAALLYVDWKAGKL